VHLPSHCSLARSLEQVLLPPPPLTTILKDLSVHPSLVILGNLKK
jgi:hypothetical protein